MQAQPFPDPVAGKNHCVDQKDKRSQARVEPELNVVVDYLPQSPSERFYRPKRHLIHRFRVHFARHAQQADGWIQDEAFPRVPGAFARSADLKVPGRGLGNAA